MMGSFINFKNFVETPQSDGNFPLVSQSSIFSLTFDELQNTLRGPGKDFGSMNMDELLKNIWTAEETQAMEPSSGGGEGSIAAPIGNNLQRQGSLTLPRTLSQKTVDEVWRELFRESSGANEGSGGGGGGQVQLPHGQPTLGEMTLEEFLVRAGVVREDAQQIGPSNNDGFYGEMSQRNGSHIDLTFGVQQPARNNVVPANQTTGSNSSVPSSVPSQHPHPQLLFPRQVTVAFASSVPLVNNAQLASPGTRGLIVGMADPSINNGSVQGSLIQSGGVRGRRCGGPFEKAIEKRQKRMVKNRESSARSRARKQAYTLELEAEIEELKEINQELQKKQDEIIEMQKNQALETVNTPCTSKRRCLRRTLTGPW